MNNIYNKADKDLIDENITEISSKNPLIRLGIVTTMYKRFDLAEIVFANIAYLKNALKEYVEIIPAVAGSEGEASREIALRHDFLYIEIDNMPLGKKYNAALSLLKDKDIDGVMVMGSDDLLNEKYFIVLLEKIIAGHKIIGVDIFYLFDRYSSMLLRWLGYPPPRSDEPIGLGRFIHKQYLERLDYKLWDDEKCAGLDRSMWARLKQCSIQHNEPFNYYQIKCQENEIVLLDIKHEVQMWSIEDMIIGVECIDIVGHADIFLKKNFPNVSWDAVFLVAPPSFPSFKLENVSYPLPSGRHICFILPCVQGEGISDMEYSYSVLIRQCRKKGYRVSIISLDTYCRAITIKHCGLSTEDIYHASSILKYEVDFLCKNVPDVLIYSVDEKNIKIKNDIISLCKIVKAEKIIADVRFVEHENIVDLIEPAAYVITTNEQKKTLAKANAIPEGKELCCYELYSLPLQDISFLIREYRPNVALNIDLEGFSESIKNIVTTLNYKFKEWKQQNIRLFISCVDKAKDQNLKDSMSNFNIFLTYNTNYQMWNKMFCIHIFDLKSDRIAHCADVLMTGTPVIAPTSMANKLGIGEEYGLFAVENYAQAFNLVLTLQKNKDMWEQAAKNALASKKIFASESYFSVLN